MMTGQGPDPVHRRNRSLLVVIYVLFFGGMLVAGLLRFSGWQPQGTKNKGEMLQPYADLRQYAPTLAAGDVYRWSDSPRTWRIVVAPQPCDGARSTDCRELLRGIDTVWQLMGKDADRVHVLWVGPPPAGLALPREVRVVRADAVLPAQLPHSGDQGSDQAGDTAWLVDPNGFVVLRYAPGFDPGDLRTDLSRLLKVN
ncbi:MAG: hypothetical protein ABIP16_01300 [Thermomonas sp.]